MSTRGVDFLHRWIDENLAGFHQAIIDGDLVAALTRRCLAEAGDEGLVPAEIEEDMGPLETIIREAILNNPTDEVAPHMRFGLN